MRKLEKKKTPLRPNMKIIKNIIKKINMIVLFSYLLSCLYSCRAFNMLHV